MMKRILISCVAFILSAQEQRVLETTTGEVILDLVVRDEIVETHRSVSNAGSFNPSTRRQMRT
jgi:hypothetical protein